MVQNKSGMTSDSLVDIAELIPDAVKYEVYHNFFNHQETETIEILGFI